MFQSLAALSADGDPTAKEQGRQLAISMIPELANTIARYFRGFGEAFADLGNSTPKELSDLSDDQVKAVMALLLTAVENTKELSKIKI
ncbi:hypothetical protein [Actinomadura sp. B10D3]|uniref:hypothetical protein n=1 Tax=Actinomadura sp. B10D3 TaxID=3153557 RepID=UPI00325E2BF9